jgi:hypothetical protein
MLVLHPVETDDDEGKDQGERVGWWYWGLSFQLGQTLFLNYSVFAELKYQHLVLVLRTTNHMTQLRDSKTSVKRRSRNIHRILFL